MGLIRTKRIPPGSVDPQSPAQIYSRGVSLYFEKQYQEALRCFKIVADLGDRDAQYNCGFMYDCGKGTDEDEAAALHYYKLAADQGHQSAIRWLASQEKDPAVDPPQEKKPVAQPSVKKESPVQPSPKKEPAAPVQEKPRQLYDRGITLYNQGQHREALRYFKLAADQSLAKAQYACGCMYDRGEGISVDRATALHYYKLAADQGYTKALFACGCMYDGGEGTSVNKSAALRYYKLAADQGHATAQFNCGIMYYNGIETDRDKNIARQYFDMAANQTDNLDVRLKATEILNQYF